MAKFKNEQGEEVEAFTAEEVEQKLAQAKTEFAKESEAAMAEVKTQFETVKTELESIKSQREEDQQKLDDLNKNADQHGGEQSENFKTLKAGFERSLKERDSKIEELQKNFQESEQKRNKEYTDKFVEQLAKGDEELQKKINFHLNETLKAMPGSTEKEATEKVKAAYKLAVDRFDAPDVMDIALGSGGRGEEKFNSSDAHEFTQGEKDLGSKLGITEEDRKKYAPKLTTKKPS